MQVNDLPTDIQNKIFYFLEHPTAAMIRGHNSYRWYEFYAAEEDQRYWVEVNQIRRQLRHKLKVRFITTEETKKSDPLFLHMNRAIIDFIIEEDYIEEIRERRYLCPGCQFLMKDCKCDPYEFHKDCDCDCICKSRWRLHQVESFMDLITE